MKKRLLSLLLAVMMLVSAMPFAFGTVSAEEANAEEPALTYADLYVQDGLTMLLTAYNESDLAKYVDLTNGVWKSAKGETFATFVDTADAASWAKRNNGASGVGYDLTAADVKGRLGDGIYIDLGDLPVVPDAAGFTGYTVERVAQMFLFSTTDENGKVVRPSLASGSSAYTTSTNTDMFGAWSLLTGIFSGSRGNADAYFKLNTRVSYRKGGWGHGSYWMGSLNDSVWGGFVKNSEKTAATVDVSSLSTTVRDRQDLQTTYTTDASGIYVYEKVATTSRPAWYCLADKNSKIYTYDEATDAYIEYTAKDAKTYMPVDANGDALDLGNFYARIYNSAADVKAWEYIQISTLTRYKQVKEYLWSSTMNNYHAGKFYMARNSWTTDTNDKGAMRPLAQNGNKHFYYSLDTVSADFYTMRNAANTTYAIRVYDRVLTDKEVAWNYAVDLLAYFGLSVAGVDGLNDVQKNAMAAELGAYTFSSTDTAAMQAIVDKYVAAAANEAVQNEYDALYVQDGMTLLLTAFDADDASVSLENGYWLNKAGNGAATIFGGAYDSASNQIGWRKAEDGKGIYYRMQTVEVFNLKKATVGIELPASALSKGDATLEMVFTPLYISTEDNDLVYHYNDGVLSQYGAYTASRSSFAFGALQFCYFFPSQYLNASGKHSASSTTMRTFYYQNSWDGGANGNVNYTNAYLFGRYDPTVTTSTLLLNTVVTMGVDRTVDEMAEGALYPVVTHQITTNATSYSIVNGTDNTITKLNQTLYTAEDAAIRRKTNTAFEAFVGFPAEVYAIRAYDRVLSDAEKAQNHFADLCAYFEVSLDGFNTLYEANRAAVYAACEDITFETEEAASAIVSAINSAVSEQNAYAPTAEGYQKGNDGTSLRIWASISADLVNNANATALGMEIKVTGDAEKVLSGETDRAYTKITSGDEVLQEEGKLFYAAIVDGIPEDMSFTFVITPYVVVDGAKVYGESVTLEWPAVEAQA